MSERGSSVGARRGGGSRNVQEVTRVGEPRADVDGGEESEVADLYEARGEDVVEEAADEFDGRTRRARAPAGAKDDGGVVAVDQAVIRDRDPMRVVAEMAKHLLRSAERPLGIHDPGVIVEALATAAGGAIIGIVLELTRGEQRGEFGQKFAAEECAEDMHGKQKRGRGRNPARTIARESAARDETVNVGMKVELAGPGVEDGRDRELRRLGEPCGSRASASSVAAALLSRGAYKRARFRRTSPCSSLGRVKTTWK